MSIVENATTATATTADASPKSGLASSGGSESPPPPPPPPSSPSTTVDTLRKTLVEALTQSIAIDH